MATAVPATAPTPSAGRLVTFKEALALLEETGFGVKDSSLRRWIKQDRVPRSRMGGQHWYSYSDLLVLHRVHVLDPIFGSD